MYRNERKQMRLTESLREITVESQMVTGVLDARWERQKTMQQINFAECEKALAQIETEADKIQKLIELALA